MSIEIEKAVLATFLKDPGYIAEVSGFINPAVFKADPREGGCRHRTLYETFLSVFNETGTLDTVLVTTKLKAVGIHNIGSLDTIEYVSHLSTYSVDVENKQEYVKELIKYHKLREIYVELKTLEKELKESTSKPISEIMSLVETRCASMASMNVSDTDEEAVDLYGTCQEKLEEIALSEKSAIIKTGMTLFDGFWGGLYYGGLTLICAFYKVGKSALLQEISRQCCLNKVNNDMIVLYLDTEMNHIENQSRIAATYSGNNVDDFEEGLFMKDEKKKLKAQKGWDKMKPLHGKVYHVPCGDMDIERLKATIKRFHAKVVKDKDFLIVYDYLKLTGETLSEHNKEYQVLGDKSNALKKLSESLPRTSVLTAVQLNEQGGVASASRMKWFASLIIYFERIADAERFRFKGAGIEATHILKSHACRKLGPLGRKEEIFKVRKEGSKKDEFVKNGVLLNMDNFELTEKGTYKEAYERSEEPELDISNKKSAKKDWAELLAQTGV